jgi:hypothetical protein
MAQKLVRRWTVSELYSSNSDHLALSASVRVERLGLQSTLKDI